jgi:hypothetical protein
MNDEVTILRDRLRDYVRNWVDSAEGDFRETLAKLRLADPVNSFQDSPQDSLMIGIRKRALREAIAKLNAKTELLPVWQDIITELCLEKMYPFSWNNTKNHKGKRRMEAEILSSPDMKPETKPIVAIVVAIIGLIASVLSSVIASRATAHDTAKATAQSTANAAIQAFQERISGGTIDADMNQKDQVGRDFTVNKQGAGLFRIQFRPPFSGSTVVAVAAPHKDKIATLARIETHDGGSILVGIHQVSDDTLVDAPFSFYVLEAVPIKP